MEFNDKVLVVGTSADYIEWIRKAVPGRALFLTSPAVREAACEPTPEASEEILCDLDDETEIKKKLADHFRNWEITPAGITAFDCESMEMASRLAEHYSLQYPSLASIRFSRDKNAMNRIWRLNSVPCPEARLLRTAAEVRSFMKDINGPCILKPLTGSGSELVVSCRTEKECEAVVRALRKGLAIRKNHQLYRGESKWFLAEEFVSGEEFSCDFAIRNSRVTIIRTTRKIKNDSQPFGTIMGYVLTDPPPEAEDECLADILSDAAESLGIDDAICMVDFMVSDGKIVLLEMTPRPGGDCLPHLMKKAGMVDILALAIDFAGNKERVVPVRLQDDYVGLRLHLSQGGVIHEIEYDSLPQDPRILEVHIIRGPGHRVCLPPDDYESWLLGHLVFKADPGIEIEAQCFDLSRKIRVDIRQ